MSFLKEDLEFENFKICFILIISLWVCVHICECRCLQRPELLDSSKIGVTGSCELSDRGVRNQTWVFCKINIAVRVSVAVTFTALMKETFVSLGLVYSSEV